MKETPAWARERRYRKKCEAYHKRLGQMQSARADLARSEKANADLRSDNGRLRGENERLREAMTRIANPESWKLATLTGHRCRWCGDTKATSATTHPRWCPVWAAGVALRGEDNREQK